jgi:hypothetical protein
MRPQTQTKSALPPLPEALVRKLIEARLDETSGKT